MMLTTLANATRSTSGGKATMLGVLLRAGLPVPDGFVIPADTDRPTDSQTTAALRSAVARELERLGDPVVAVRSSAANEDTSDASAAGQYESIIGVRGVDDVSEAIATCRASAHAARVGTYRQQTGSDSEPEAPGGMAVLVQRMIPADVSGVMFTPTHPGNPTRIEASWGLGLAVVGGTVTPDAYLAAPDGSATMTIGSKETRIDLHPAGGITTTPVATDKQAARTLDDETVTVLVDTGVRIATILDGPQDIEWAIADGRVWILQARPITAPLPSPCVSDEPTTSEQTFTGTPGSHGSVTATARIVRGLADFPSVRPGEVVICPYTDPAWTPLFTIVAGVVTETGGALSHAAIVAREYGIPAVLGVTDATTSIRDGDRVALDGTTGTLTIL